MVIHNIRLSPKPVDRLDATFAALADPTRRAILAHLARGDASVAELTRLFAMSQPAISKHLKVLERAGLITRGHEAQRRPSHIVAQPLADASKWLESYRRIWEAGIQHLDAAPNDVKSHDNKAGARTTRGSPHREIP
jgi:DNA-binding transcriptional ArsR family regulator